MWVKLSSHSSLHAEREQFASVLHTYKRLSFIHLIFLVLEQNVFSFSGQENLLKNPSSGKCLQLKGGKVFMDYCNAADMYQRWTFSWPPSITVGWLGTLYSSPWTWNPEAELTQIQLEILQTFEILDIQQRPARKGILVIIISGESPSVGLVFIVLKCIYWKKLEKFDQGWEF